MSEPYCHEDAGVKVNIDADMASDVAIRQARRNEYPLIENMMVDSFRRTGLFVSEAYERDMRSLERHSARWTVWIATDADGGNADGAGSAIFGAVLTPRTAVEKPESLISSMRGERMFRFLSVSPEAQGRGIGRMLVNHSIAEIGRLGVPRVGIYTGFPLTHAIHLYRSIGFVRHPEQEHRLHEGHRLLRYIYDIPDALVRYDPAVNRFERDRVIPSTENTPGSWTGFFRALHERLPWLALHTDERGIMAFCRHTGFSLGRELPLGIVGVRSVEDDAGVRAIADEYRIPVFTVTGVGSFHREDAYQTGIVLYHVKG